MIKAIETEYNGYRFRSRLEARWAVFFDEIGTKYEYELEGFEVKWNEDEIYRYLPDFYLPQHDIWVEVKPNKTKLLEDAEKISMCIDYGNTQISYSTGLMILGQIPYFDENDIDNIPAFNILWWDKGVCSELARFVLGDSLKLNIGKNCPYDITSAPDFPELLSNEELIYYCRGIGYTDNCGIQWKLSDYSQKESAHRLKKAFVKARSARFEYGEKG